MLSPVRDSRTSYDIFNLHRRRREGITKRDIVVYGIIVPAALLAACLLAEYINTL